ncbi:hypothetical protein DAI22_08g152500 [Oryza sativa Japonica Group]|nr:hypothetical protein DAI22_08g152500 [Oryza sativa Japonica Group]
MATWWASCCWSIFQHLVVQGVEPFQHLSKTLLPFVVIVGNTRHGLWWRMIVGS